MLYFSDREESKIYRFEARSMRVRDNAESARMRSAIDNRARSGDIDDELLLILYNYPLVKFGAKVFEVATLDVMPETDDDPLPDDMNWRTVDFTEDAYMDMPEDLIARCVEAVYEANPQRRFELDFLKKTLELLGSVNGSATSPSDSPTPTAPANGTGSAKS